jgi:hypothetical protein
VSRSIELEAAATQPPKSEPFDIVNDEKQKEKQVADHFFRSLLESRRVVGVLGRPGNDPEGREDILDWLSSPWQNC